MGVMIIILKETYLIAHQQITKEKLKMLTV